MSSESPPPQHQQPQSPFMLHGLRWPRFCPDAEWENRLALIAAMETRPDDVFIIAYPKCGFHWSKEFLRMIRSGSTEITAGRLKFWKLLPHQITMRCLHPGCGVRFFTDWPVVARSSQKLKEYFWPFFLLWCTHMLLVRYYQTIFSQVDGSKYG